MYVMTMGPTPSLEVELEALTLTLPAMKMRLLKKEGQSKSQTTPRSPILLHSTPLPYNPIHELGIYLA